MQVRGVEQMSWYDDGFGMMIQACLRKIHDNCVCISLFLMRQSYKLFVLRMSGDVSIGRCFFVFQQQE